MTYFTTEASDTRVSGYCLLARKQREIAEIISRNLGGWPVNRCAVWVHAFFDPSSSQDDCLNDRVVKAIKQWDAAQGETWQLMNTEAA